MTTKKITKRDSFNEVIKLEQENGRNDLVEFAQHEIDLLDSKKSNNTMTTTQKENENIKTIILEELGRVGKAVTITELQAQSEKLANYSNQKVSALLKQLVDAKAVAKVTDKKKSYFTIAD